MEEQQVNDMCLLDFGLRSSYKNKHFVYKMFPNVPRLTKDEATTEEVARHTEAGLEVAARSDKKWLTRNEYPFGSAGFLLFQAKSLLAGLEQEAVWDQGLVDGYTDADKRDSRSLFVSDESDDRLDGREWNEARILRWMGSIMIATTYSALACELIMKSIALTCNDRAKKIHNLQELFADLPKSSRDRIVTDQPGVEDLFRVERETSGSWRYLEPNKKERGLRTLIDVEAARQLGRVARVLLDEAEVVGLRIGFSFSATRNIDDSEHSRKVDDLLNEPERR